MEQILNIYTAGKTTSKHFDPEKLLGTLRGGVILNTRISYLYRDAGNYKKHNEVVVPGTFTPEQIETITGCLDAGGYCDAE